MVVLGAANAFIMKQFWPFLTVLVWLFAIAGYSFARLLLVVGHSSPAA